MANQSIFISGSYTNNNNSSPIPTGPATVVPGNLLVAVVYGYGVTAVADPTQPISGGWSLAYNATDTASGQSWAIWTKIATAADKNATYSYFGTGSGSGVVDLLQYDNATGIEGTQVTWGTLPTATIPAVTTTQDNEQVIACIGNYDVASTQTTPAGWTARVSGRTGSAALYAFERNQATAGASPTGSSTTSAGGKNVATVAFALVPGGGGGQPATFSGTGTLTAGGRATGGTATAVPVYVNGASANNTAGNTVVVNVPTMTAGNLLVAVLYNSNSTPATITPPAGWTVAGQRPNGSGGGLAFLTKTATASEPFSYTFGWGNGLAASVLQYASAPGVDGTPVFAFANSAAASAPATTAAAAGETELVAYGSFAGNTFTAPTGATLRQSTRAAGNTSLYVADRTVTAGAVPAAASTQSAAAAYVAGSILLAPAPAATQLQSAKGTASPAAVTSLAVTAPAALVPGNLLVAVQYVTQASTTLGAPADWTLAGSYADTFGTAGVWTKTVTGAEPGSYPFTSRSAGAITVEVMQYASAGLDGPPALASFSSSKTPPSPAVTTSTANATVVGAWLDYNATLPSAGPAGWSLEDSVNTGAKPMVVYDTLQPTAGPSTPGAPTYSSATGTSVAFALLPAAGGAAPALTGAAALSGAGTLAATGTATQDAAPALTGSTDLTGTGALAATGVPRVATGAALTGTGLLGATGVPAMAPSGAALAGTGGLTGTGVPRPVGSAVALAGTGGLATASSPSAATSAPLSGVGALTAAGTPQPAAPAALSGAGVLTAAGQPRATAAPALTGTGTLTAAGTSTQGGAAATSLAGAGALVVAGSGFLAGQGTAVLTGGGTLTTSSVPRPAAGVALTGAGQLTTATGPITTHPLIAMAGAGALTAAGSPSSAGAGGLTGAGQLTAGGVPGTSGGGALSGTGQITVLGVPGGRALAALGGQGTLGAAGLAALLTRTDLTGAGRLTAAATYLTATTPVTLTGVGDLAAVGAAAVAYDTWLAGSGLLTATGEFLTAWRDIEVTFTPRPDLDSTLTVAPRDGLALAAAAHPDPTLTATSRS